VQRNLDSCGRGFALNKLICPQRHGQPRRCFAGPAWVAI
jgi:hypothetical protein